MVDSQKTRISGKTASEESAKEAGEASDVLLDSDIEQRKLFRTPGFQRMRTDWRQEDQSIVSKAHRVANELLLETFKDGFNILNWVHREVREPEIDENGEIKIVDDKIVWKRNEFGVYIEDYSRLTNRQRDNLLFTIGTRLFGWEQKAQDAWHEAMLAKGTWEERYAIGFDAPMSGTQGDRDAAGRKDSSEERYFAIFMTAFSRKAEAFVRDMTRLQDLLRASLKS